jgi:protein O-mannosyl-transferase
MKPAKDSKKAKPPVEPKSTSWAPLLAGILLLVLLITYLPALDASFHNNWDDNAYITTNQRVQKGLSLDNVVWAFTTNSVGFYYPLTWLSHMTDVQLYGLHPKGHYATNIILHCLNVLMFFLLLLLSTNSQFRSFLAAMLFALHPMNVESVAWLAERKNLLSSFFLLLALICYVLKYNKSDDPKASSRFSIGCYLFFMMGLMAKSSIVMFPFLLLLFDIWPLKRISLDAIKEKKAQIRELFVEKMPFFFLSFISGILTITAQKDIKALIPLAHVSFPTRIGEALLGYAFYLEKFFAPFNLCAFYPQHRENLPFAIALLVLTLMSVITVIFYMERKKNPIFITGWLFFVISLFPVIGIIQVGSQAHADRYVYFPYWGLFIILIFGINRGNSGIKALLTGLLMAVFIVFFFLTRTQTAHWKDDEALFNNVIKVSPETILGYFQLGSVYLAKEEPGKALPLFQKARDIENKRADIMLNIGSCYMKMKNYDKALDSFDLAIASNPQFGSAYYDKACALINMGKSDEAQEFLALALKNGFDASLVAETTKAARAGNINQLFGEGQKYGSEGKWGEAERAIRKALELAPDKADGWSYLGYVFQNEKNVDDAQKAYQKALDLDSSLDVAVYNLALIEIQKKEFDKAGAKLKALEQKNSSYAASLKKQLNRMP